jgi:xanthine phosphoribosyltransferase
MRLLEERILKDGLVMEGDVLKVDGFLNHQMDVQLFQAMAEEWKRLFAGCEINKILTIEASGIGIACIAGLSFGCPVVFAKKTKTRNIAGDVYRTQVKSYTHNNISEVIVSKQFLGAGDRLLLIDDFLANGAALSGLLDLAAMAGAQVIGAGIAIEKAYQPGGKLLRERGLRIESLARISAMDDSGRIEFVS